VVALVGATAVVSTALFVEETLKKSPILDINGEEAGSNALIRSGELSIWELLKSLSISVVIYTFWHIAVLAFTFTTILPVFWFTPIYLGGYDFSPLQISLIIGLNGAAQAA
jgi:hypothetical protein